jgi:hypothetical protein
MERARHASPSGGIAALVGALSLALLTSGCAGLFLAAQSDQAATSVLPATDVVIETNLQSAASGIGAGATTPSGGGGGGIKLPTGIGGGGEGAAISSIEGGGTATSTTLPSHAPGTVQGSGGAVTTGPSTGVGVLSEAGEGGVAAYAGFNKLSNDCLGLIVIPAGGTTTPALGQTTAGTYRFWVRNTTSAACDASSFLLMTTVPVGWAKGDPSPNGFPLP